MDSSHYCRNPADRHVVPVFPEYQYRDEDWLWRAFHSAGDISDLRAESAASVSVQKEERCADTGICGGFSGGLQFADLCHVERKYPLAFHALILYNKYKHVPEMDVILANINKL